MQEKDACNIYKDMEKIKVEFGSQKNNVIDFILERVLDVDMSIPDVVKGGFAQKLLGK